MPRDQPPKIPAAFSRVVAAFARDAEVTAGTMFRADNVVLKVGGKIFAMWVTGALVVKLPPERVAELREAGGAPFDPGHGRVLRQWVTIPPPKARWVALAREAHAYVRGQVTGAAAKPRHGAAAPPAPPRRPR